MKTHDARKLPSIAQEDLRVKAVQAVQSGKTQTEVAALFGVSRKAVNAWASAYQHGGRRALKAQKRGRPRGPGTLKSWQAALIVRMLRDRYPEQLKLPFYLWTREAVAELIERKFGLRLSVWTVGRYLMRWGFTPQKPVRRAYERDPEQVQLWLEHDYPEIRARGQREKAQIYWGDEAGLRSDHTVGRTYGQRGQTPVIPGTGQRFGCNMISAITNRGQLNFMVFKCRFSSEVFISFLQRLSRQAGRKFFMIVDGHPCHRSKRVQKFQAQNADKFELFYLPGYSPELNPDEMVNQDVKSNALGRRRPHNKEEMITNVRSYLRNRQRQPTLVRSYFNEQNVRYAAP
jgi:transposase